MDGPPSPDPSATTLPGERVVHLDDRLRSGRVRLQGNARHTLIEALVNGSWDVVPSPDQGTADNLLDSVSCSTSTSCVAAATT